MFTRVELDGEAMTSCPGHWFARFFSLRYSHERCMILRVVRGVVHFAIQLSCPRPKLRLVLPKGPESVILTLSIGRVIFTQFVYQGSLVVWFSYACIDMLLLIPCLGSCIKDEFWTSWPIDGSVRFCFV